MRHSRARLSCATGADERDAENPRVARHGRGVAPLTTTGRRPRTPRAPSDTLPRVALSRTAVVGRRRSGPASKRPREAAQIREAHHVRDVARYGFASAGTQSCAGFFTSSVSVPNWLLT